MRASGRGTVVLVRTLVVALLGTTASSCAPLGPPADGDGDDDLTFNNTTDPSNNGAKYIGSNACRACHASLAEVQIVHGHNHTLTRVEGGPPVFPEEATRADVPDPPQGYDWSQISYVIGGYTRGARFIDLDGYILTTGVEGVPTQWQLSFPPNGTEPAFVPYEPEAAEPLPYDFSSFRFHTTGPRPQDAGDPRWEENRPGILGTWTETGVRCEACHGPGSNHIPNPPARDLFVGSSASECGFCHSAAGDPSTILVRDGFIQHQQQWSELLSSGGHSGFDCTTCHDPHLSVNYDRDDAIRNECAVCHSGMSMAIHDGRVFVRGDYTEALSCVSCHMSYAAKNTSSAGPETVGEVGRMGDTKTHIFRIDPQVQTYTDMFLPNGGTVAKDESGQASVSLDFVCVRCHNGIGNAPIIPSLDVVSEIATGMHDKQFPGKAVGRASNHGEMRVNTADRPSVGAGGGR